MKPWQIPDTPSWLLRLTLRSLAYLDIMPTLRLAIALELGMRAAIVAILEKGAVARAVHDVREDGGQAYPARGGDA